MALGSKRRRDPGRPPHASDGRHRAVRDRDGGRVPPPACRSAVPPLQDRHGADQELVLRSVAPGAAAALVSLLRLEWRSPPRAVGAEAYREAEPPPYPSVISREARS